MYKHTLKKSTREIHAWSIFQTVWTQYNSNYFQYLSLFRSFAGYQLRNATDIEVARLVWTLRNRIAVGTSIWWNALQLRSKTILPITGTKKSQGVLFSRILWMVDGAHGARGPRVNMVPRIMHTLIHTSICILTPIR